MSGTRCRAARGSRTLGAYGANLDYMRSLCAYWANGYDWRKWEAELNRFPQFKARVEDIDIHFYRVDGNGPPLILSHGWPGSVFEFLHTIDSLAKDFTVVVPSLPGYGFSGKPARPISPRTVARLFDMLMTDVLKLPNYIAQGGDWGSVISGWMAYEGKGCRAAHLNMFGWRSSGVHPETKEEIEYAQRAMQLFEMEGAYFREQTTKPQTLSYAMMDSPVGACAWDRGEIPRLVRHSQWLRERLHKGPTADQCDDLSRHAHLQHRNVDVSWGLSKIRPARLCRRRRASKSRSASRRFPSISSRFRRARWSSGI
ncbi:MAG: epoxide hydrolase [Rhizomicrobium sp.]